MCAPEREAHRVGQMQLVRVLLQLACLGGGRLSHALVLLLVERGFEVEGDAELLPQCIGGGVAAMDVEAKAADTHRLQAALHHIESRRLLCNEQHCLPHGERLCQQVGDRLGLSCARRALEDKRASHGGRQDRLKLRAVVGDGAVDVGGLDLPRRRGESLVRRGCLHLLLVGALRSLDQVLHHARGTHEVLPVVAQVEPHAKLAEAQHRQRAARLEPDETVLDARLLNASEERLERALDTVTRAGPRIERGDREAEGLPQHLHQAVVENSATKGPVKHQAWLPAVADHQPHRHQQEGAVHLLLFLVGPDHRPQGQVQIVHTRLRLDFTRRRLEVVDPLNGLDRELRRLRLRH
mmetsp:Transcript_49430/g.163738  ORF Transcript_49430/g.163738 Transcript_49430/m.163738 type:complete len:352 (-) Transcript_49430:248-1303(-)